MLRLYDFRCSNCGTVFEKILDISQQDNRVASCVECNGHADKLLPLIRINMGVGAHGRYDETLGKYVGTNKEWREECIRQGVTPKGDTPKPRDLHYKELTPL